MSELPNRLSNGHWVKAFALIFSLLLLAVGLYLGRSEIACELNHSKPQCMTAADWGSFLGGVFAPSAFVWLFASVWIQSLELNAQSEELRLTRLEFEQNREVMQQQAEEAKRSAEYIGTQTELLKRQEAERTLNVLIEGLAPILKRFDAAFDLTINGQKRQWIGPNTIVASSDTVFIRMFIETFMERFDAMKYRGMKSYELHNEFHFVRVFEYVATCMLTAEQAGKLG